jgi:hypothetical protein
VKELVSGESPKQTAKGNSPDTATPGQPKDERGLVICPITVRSEIESKLLNLAEQMKTPEDLFSSESGHFIVLTPGSLRLKRRGVGTAKKPVYQDRQMIKSWSKKSRANMVSRFSSLDLTPLANDNSNALAVMITLTYPSDWESLVPTASHAKSHLHQFRKRFERRFGRPCYAMWKAEFQRRGAIHFHLFTASPIAVGEFREWVRTVWSEIVNPEPEEEREKHLRAGTAVDIFSGATIGDARLIAVYFSKHSSANFGVKEYQNSPPRKWIDGGSVGRFWGYWNLKPLEVEARISQREAFALARVLRRWFRSKDFTRVERVARIDQQGTITYRKVRRRSKRMSQSFGFITLEDTVLMSEDLGRLLQLMRQTGAVAPGEVS